MPITNPAAASGFEISLQFGYTVLLVLALVGGFLFILSLIRSSGGCEPAPKGDQDPDLEYLYDPDPSRSWESHPRH